MMRASLGERSSSARMALLVRLRAQLQHLTEKNE
jgi:hypothetical protein